MLIGLDLAFRPNIGIFEKGLFCKNSKGINLSFALE